jgi:hypothetical protein
MDRPDRAGLGLHITNSFLFREGKPKMQLLCDKKVFTDCGAGQMADL